VFISGAAFGRPLVNVPMARICQFARNDKPLRYPILFDHHSNAY